MLIDLMEGERCFFITALMISFFVAFGQISPVGDKACAALYGAHRLVELLSLISEGTYNGSKSGG